MKQTEIIKLTDQDLRDKLAEYQKKLRETWLKSRKSFQELVSSLDESILKKGILRHPIAGRIDINMTLQFIKMHFHHHRKIIAKLESKIKSN